MGAELKVDTISEKTSSNGVVIDLVTIKDGIVNASGINLGSAALVESELEILDGANITTTELNIIDGDTAATATTVVDADRVVFNDNGTMKQVAVTDLSAYFDDEITAMPNLITTAATTVGALNSGSITSGFGTIDTGSSAITSTGTVTYGTLNDGTTALSSTVAELNYSDLATLGTTAASKIFTADANNYTKVTGAVANEEATLTDASTIVWDVVASPVAKVTLSNNRTLAAPSGSTPIAGQFIALTIIQDGTGSRTVTFNAVYEFASDTTPTLTTTASKGDQFVFKYNGSKWLEVGRNLNLTLS
jgi:hypothetical protein